MVVVAPGLGDALQAIKSGILEIGDIFVVNKVDRPDVDQAVQDLEAAISMREKEGWRPPVVKTNAADGSGIEGLMNEIANHGYYWASGREISAAKARAASNEIKEAIKTRLLKDFLKEDMSRGEVIEKLAREICMRKDDLCLFTDEPLKRTTTGLA